MHLQCASTYTHGAYLFLVARAAFVLATLHRELHNQLERRLFFLLLLACHTSRPTRGRGCRSLSGNSRRNNGSTLSINGVTTHTTRGRGNNRNNGGTISLNGATSRTTRGRGSTKRRVSDIGSTLSRSGDTIHRRDRDESSLGYLNSGIANARHSGRSINRADRTLRRVLRDICRYIHTYNIVNTYIYIFIYIYIYCVICINIYIYICIYIYMYIYIYHHM